MVTPRLLLVEDDEKLGAQVAEELQRLGWEVEWIRDGAVASAANPAEYSVVVLDLMLPRRDGLDVLKSWRSTSDVPVIVLSAKDETRTKVRALELGADDYMTKPFWPEELVARIKARLRRPTAIFEDRVELGDLQIDLGARTVTLRSEDVALTRVEFDLLAELARRPNTAIQRLSLAEKVLDPDREGTDRTLDVHISRLRKKLGDYAPCVATVWGVGYRFEPERAP